MNKKEMKAMQKRNVSVVSDILSLLSGVADLRVCDASEILRTCDNIIGERASVAMANEAQRPLVSAIEHLQKPVIHAPTSRDISQVAKTH